MVGRPDGLVGRWVGGPVCGGERERHGDEPTTARASSFLCRWRRRLSSLWTAPTPPPHWHWRPPLRPEPPPLLLLLLLLTAPLLLLLLLLLLPLGGWLTWPGWTRV